MPRISQQLHPPEDSTAGVAVTATRVGVRAGRSLVFQSHELPFGELALTGSSAQHPHVLDWQSERPVPLLKDVLRLTAPNSSFMTGPGTNSYLVGDATSGFIVIDPGPDDSAHVERLFQAAAAAGGCIRAIVCTHSHSDHAPGAQPLQALCQQRGDSPPILGLPSAATAPPKHFFRPDRALRDGERLTLTSADGTTHTLRAIFTPGHAANHVCLVLEEDALLFCGDHILSGSTTVIDPPDGDMSAYLDSLTKLDALCGRENIGFALSAHGLVLADVRSVIARLKAHRLVREAKVLAALRAAPRGGIDHWVTLAYGDMSPNAWYAARRSLMAHVQRLRKLGAV
jgi:glyoxylase-like metal-dependent hydrolase (beta-lactamase superfamily II)